jgi:hypothetical protein
MQRVVGVLLLLPLGMLSLPLAAYALGDQGAENWILPLQLVVMAAIGAGITLVIPALGKAGAPAIQRALIGAAWGVAAALVGAVVFWFLLSGIGGA